jgi:hypothetical protein
MGAEPETGIVNEAIAISNNNALEKSRKNNNSLSPSQVKSSKNNSQAPIIKAKN